MSIGIAAYVTGIALTATVTAHVAWRAGTAALQHLAPATPDAPRSRDVAAEAPAARTAMSVPSAGQQSVHREAAMTPLQDRWDGRWGGPYGRPQPRMWGSPAPQFGSSARNSYRGSGDERPFGSDDDEDRRGYGTYRTVCVRLCDGYYFPVSFAVGSDRLGHDKEVCESRCGSQGRLFVHRNPGGSADDMQDLAGRPYRQLPTAFLYRTEYVASCTCQPQPWEQASLDRHRLYALAAAARNGNLAAVKEMQTLQAKLKESAKPAARPGPPSTVPAGRVDDPGPVKDAAVSARAAEIAAREDGNYMGLGGEGAPKAKTDPKPERSPPKSSSQADWIRRIFSPSQ